MALAAGWDAPRVYVNEQNARAASLDNESLKANFYAFVRNFSDDEQIRSHFRYREQLRSNKNLRQDYLTVDVQDLPEGLRQPLKDRPEQCLPWFEEGIALAARELDRDPESDVAPRHYQLLLNYASDLTAIRNLKSTNIGKLVQVPGIVISASRMMAKASRVAVRCRICQTKQYLSVQSGLSGVSLPQRCEGSELCKKAHNTFQVMPDDCTFEDQQTLKLQESPDTVPTGEMPRHIVLSCERFLCDRVSPGMRVVAVGIYTTQQQSGKQQHGAGVASVAIRQAYVRVVGLRVDSEGVGRSLPQFSQAEEDRFIKLSHRSDLVDVIARSIAPAIYGHDNIKKAIACLLFGGSRKKLPDGMRLRGDINILLLGDPGTAKSQLLKFVESVAPVGVYTSGKGSSAAGLTASVVREPHSREFYLEGGAMVLADGGVVCIDEFDKMHIHDRVAIHEAMEQQTISIAKAGTCITTILNSRTSVLAAANPVFGRYDDLKSPLENIEFQTTILSRFDLIFIVRDTFNVERDRTIASHVVRQYKLGDQRREETAGTIEPLELKCFIAYARAKCMPRLTAAAGEVLQNHYVNLRSAIRTRELRGDSSVIPITVRQLEAIIRLAESLAKMTLSESATETHVNHAINLFKVATVDAANAGVGTGEQVTAEQMSDIMAIEALLKRRLPIGSKSSVLRLVEDLVRTHQYSEQTVRRAINIMVSRDELEYRNQRKQVLRKR